MDLKYSFFKNRLKLTPVRLIVISYLLATFVAMILLSLPVSLKEGVKLSFVDTMSISVSAISVTGLSVVSTVDTFSVFGVFMLMIVMQFGAIGIMYEAYYFGVFHALSSYTNAGFDIFGDSLYRFSKDYFVQTLTMIMLILGALGFPVLIEIRTKISKKYPDFHFSLYTTYHINILHFNSTRSIKLLPIRKRPIYGKPYLA